nr:hypothetical protein [Tanacetum cinerariifolium]
MENIDLRVNKQHLLMPCLCTKCLNHIEHKVEEVKFHLFRNRIDLSYKNWIRHGEKDEPLISASKPVNAITEFVDDMDFTLDIPTDGLATVEMVNARKDNFDEDDLFKFQELLLDAEKPLYEGCPDFTKLFAIVKLLNLKGKYGASDKFFTELLGLIKKMLPAGKTKDSVNARLDLVELGVKPELFAMQEEDKTTIPPAVREDPKVVCSLLALLKEGVSELTRSVGEYHKSMETIGIPSDKYEIDENEEGKPLSADKSSEVSAELFQKAHLYVIQNTYEIVPYIKRHKQVLKIENPGKRIAFLKNEHNKSFAKWLHKEVEKELVISKESASEIVRQIPLFKYDWVNHRAGGVKHDTLSAAQEVYGKYAK